jgi:hypothetical protein
LIPFRNRAVIIRRRFLETDEEGILAGNFFGHFNAADNSSYFTGKNPMKHTEIFVGILIQKYCLLLKARNDQADKISRAR